MTRLSLSIIPPIKPIQMEYLLVDCVTVTSDDETMTVTSIKLNFIC